MALDSAWVQALAEARWDGRAFVLEREGVTLHVTSRPTTDHDIELEVRAPLPDVLVGLRVAGPRPFLGLRFETGDEAFDRQARVASCGPGDLSPLSVNGRRLVAAAIARGAYIAGGEIVLPSWAVELATGHGVDATLKAMVMAVHACVAGARDPLDKVAQIAVADPHDEVRRRFTALCDATPELREPLARARAKGANEASVETFEGLAALVTSGEAHAQKSKRQAWLKLVQLFPIDRLWPLMEAAPKGDTEMLTGHVARRAVTLEEPELRPWREALLMLARKKKLEPSAGIQCATAFGQWRMVDAIPWLASQLDREANELMRAALKALLAMPVAAEEILTRLSTSARIWVTSAAPGLVNADTELGPLFYGLLERIDDGASALDYLRTLLIRADPAVVPHAERFVVADDESVVLVSLDVLGTLGNVRHLPLVAPLSKGFFRSSAIKQTAALAMARIRERAPVAEGGLSLPTGDGGALSLDEPSS